MRGFLIALFVTIGAYITTTGSLTAQRGGPPAGPPPSPSAIRSNNNQFAGIWKLVSQEQRDAKGQVIPPTPAAAANAEGRLAFIVYDPAGYMAVAIQHGGRQKFAGQQPTPDEARAALGSYTSYWGSFSVNQANSIVTHQTFGAISTAMSGTDQVRGFTFSGNRLTLRPPVGASGFLWWSIPSHPYHWSYWFLQSGISFK